MTQHHHGEIEENERIHGIGPWTDERIAEYIEENPYRPGADEAWLIAYGISVWAIISYLKSVGGDFNRVTEAYRLPREAVEAAVAYYLRHQELIDARIAVNHATFS